VGSSTGCYLNEKLVQQNPDLELRLQLAELYELTGKLTEADNLRPSSASKEQPQALVGKALQG